MIKNIIIGFIAIACLSGILTACSFNGRNKNGKINNKATVAVSIPPQEFFVKAIAGDSVEVFSLLGNNSDPESYDPSMGQIINLENADVYIPLGGVFPFERKIISTLRSNNSHLKIVEGSKGVKPLQGTHGGGHEGEADPHIWSSAKNAKIIALNTLNALIAADSKNEDYYRANYGRLESRLDSIDKCFEKVFSQMNPKPSFIVWHPSLSYFANDYGLTQIALAGSGKEGSVKGVVDNLNKASNSKSTVCFYQTDFDSSKASALSSETGVKIVEINPMNAEWEDEIQKLYDAFTLN